MRFEIYEFKVKNDNYGWVVQKKKGSQWKHLAYHPTLGQAVNEVFERQLQRVTKHDSARIDDIQQYKAQIDRLVERMDSIRDEIMEVFHGK